MTENYFAAVERERAADAASVAATVATMLAEDLQPDVSALRRRRYYALACRELIARLDAVKSFAVVEAIVDRCAAEIRLHRAALAVGIPHRYGDFISRERVEAVATTGSTRQRNRAKVILALADGAAWPEASPAERAAVLLRALVRP